MLNQHTQVHGHPKSLYESYVYNMLGHSLVNSQKPSLKQIYDIRLKDNEIYAFRIIDSRHFNVNTRTARTPGHYAEREEEASALVSN